MAVVATVVTAYVSLMLARRRDTVVASNAIAEHAGVIEYRSTPHGRAVAVVALVTRGYMGWRFSGRLVAVVAADATAGQGGVIHENNRIPVGGDMTIRTFPSRCYVPGGFC